MKVLEDSRIVWLFMLQIVSFLGITVLGVVYYDLNEQLQLLKANDMSHEVKLQVISSNPL